MSRRHASKARREARRVRQTARAEYLRSSGTPRERRSFTWTFRGGLTFELQLVGPTVDFEPATDKPQDLPLMVVNEMLRQAIPRPSGEPHVEN